MKKTNLMERTFAVLILAGMLLTGSNSFGQTTVKYWKLLGNAGTSGATDFIGTTDTVALNFRVDKKQSGIIDPNSATANTGFGFETLTSNSGAQNSAFGYQTLNNNSTGYQNTGFGWQALTRNTTGILNTATGAYALNYVSTGTRNSGFGLGALQSTTTGSYNTAIGMQALFANQTGNSNVALGIATLWSSKTASNLVAVGDSALYNESDAVGQNTAIGSKALFASTSGNRNTATGCGAMQNTTSGIQNVADGNGALYVNSTGSQNTATGSGANFQNTIGSNNTSDGFQALYSTTFGDNNTAVGYQAGYNNTSGGLNTFIGEEAGNTGAPGANNYTAIGYNAGNSGSPTTNYFDLGNTSVTIIRAEVTGITAYSDARVKENIQENVPGLDFIKQLRPVTYNLDLHKQYSISHNGKSDNTDFNGKYDNEKIKQTGFIAQEVEKAANNVGYDFNGVHKPNSATDLYGINYTSFVVPIVKAVQELSTQNDGLKNQVAQVTAQNTALQNSNAAQQAQIQQLMSRLTLVETSLSQCCSNFQPAASQNATSAITTANGTTDVASLEQNVPNPFNASSYIKFYIPSTATAGQLVITDMNGQTLRRYNISTPGFGTQTIAAGEFAQGNYTYSLYVDGKLIDTKQMVLTR